MTSVARVWLSLALCLAHLLAVPCAMALAADGPAAPCEHCAGSGDPAPCLSAGGTMSLAQPGPVRDAAAPRPPAVPLLHWTIPPAPASTPPPLSRTAAAATGRHAGDPPLHLRFGHLRL